MHLWRASADHEKEVMMEQAVTMEATAERREGSAERASRCGCGSVTAPTLRREEARLVEEECGCGCGCAASGCGCCL